ncbi:MAG: hypothetical protein EAZ61_07205 [Oscillatoriales cyanobacterium]|nr:MAG: hypothetical protein EAZ61_07205 [Oscillatoriales cyanobacterium]
MQALRPIVRVASSAGAQADREGRKAGDQVRAERSRPKTHGVNSVDSMEVIGRKGKQVEQYRRSHRGLW